MIILSNGSVIKLPNGDWLNVQGSQNNVETPDNNDPGDDPLDPGIGGGDDPSSGEIG